MIHISQSREAAPRDRKTKHPWIGLLGWLTENSYRISIVREDDLSENRFRQCTFAKCVYLR